MSRPGATIARRCEGEAPRRQRLGASRLLALAFAILGGPGCFLDPTCKDRCDGTRIASCEWNCNDMGRSLDVTECYRRYGGTDCALQTGPSGNPLGCRMHAIESGGESPVCVDVSLPACQEVPGDVFCTGPHSEAVCRFGFTYPYDAYICSGDYECHAASFGVNCVDSPKIACDPAAFPACLDATTIVFCIGRDGEGWYRSTYPCTGTNVCTGEPGSAHCAPGPT